MLRNCKKPGLQVSWLLGAGHVSAITSLRPTVVNVYAQRSLHLMDASRYPAKLGLCVIVPPQTPHFSLPDFFGRISGSLTRCSIIEHYIGPDEVFQLLDIHQNC
ncbi:hypothetical protein EJ02DRAFT_118156 [Clathrospora elynae]|uniref:Uncharacterized protein n=1 Tax=Clathrospora elynae TaxID=706981 RepID=A0A6A5SUI0_9PLEO|nr:hypothetical protein EJ02DRAFT_118156 [Clathrospora elynae]